MSSSKKRKTTSENPQSMSEEEMQKISYHVWRSLQGNIRSYASRQAAKAAMDYADMVCNTVRFKYPSGGNRWDLRRCIAQHRVNMAKNFFARRYDPKFDIFLPESPPEPTADDFENNPQFVCDFIEYHHSDKYRIKLQKIQHLEAAKAGEAHLECKHGILDAGDDDPTQMCIFETPPPTSLFEDSDDDQEFFGSGQSKTYGPK